MKKLMTMIAAVATAFGLYADVATGTGFESTTGAGSLDEVVENIDELTDAKDLQAAYWDLSALSETVTATVTAYSGDEYTGDFPSKFVDEAGNYYLALKTGTNEVTRYYSDAKTAFTLSKDAPKVFFDSVVKFSVFDADPEIDANAKAAVWLQDFSEAEEGAKAATNLMVNVGGVTYDCGDAAALADAWKRVTIKAMTIDKSNEVLGFMVFVQKSAVATDDDVDFTGITLKPELKAFADAGKLFPAKGKAAEITSVGFQGQGSIDTIVFTDTAPDFAPDPEAYEIVWDTAKMSNIMTNDAPVEGASPVVVPGAKPDSMIVSWTGVGTYASGKNKSVTDFDLTQINVPAAEATFNGVNWTLADAITEAEAAAEPGELKLLTAVTAGGIALNKAGTIVDLAGFGVTGNLTGAFDLTNSGVGDVFVDGECIPDNLTGAIKTLNIHLDYTKNLDGLTGDPYIGLTPPTGYEWAAEGTAYWYLKEIPQTITVTVGDPDANATVSVVSNATATTLGAGTYTLPKNDKLVVTYAAKPGYEFKDGQAEWTLNTDGAVSTCPTATAKTLYVVTYTNGVEYVREAYTFGGTAPTLTAPVYDTEKEAWDGKWYEDDTYTIEFTFDATKTVDQAAYAKITEKSAPLPDPIKDGNDKQKEDYAKWAQDNNITDADPINAVAFALNVSVALDIEKDVQDALDDVLETEPKAAAEVAKFSADYTPDYFYIENYPNAKFIFVEEKKIEAENGKFFRLKAVFNPLP